MTDLPIPMIFMKLEQDAAINMKRKHFRFLVREQIKELSQEEFQQLCIVCLHEVHHPLFQEWFKATHTMIAYISNPKSKKSDVKYWTYLSDSHRKTLTVRLTELGDEGYTPAVLEWLMIHQHWNPKYEQETVTNNPTNRQKTTKKVSG